jgi:hypothetical protein
VGAAGVAATKAAVSTTALARVCDPRPDGQGCVSLRGTHFDFLNEIPRIRIPADRIKETHNAKA